MGQQHGQHASKDTWSPILEMERLRGQPGSIRYTARYHIGKDVCEDYQLASTILGNGVNGPVRLARRGSKCYAVKSYRKRRLSHGARSELRSEVEVYLKLDHPHVVRLEDVYETSQDLQIVMEIMTGGELYDRLAKRGHFTEADAAGAARQMLMAVAYLHAHSITHRDLKLENFLYESPNTEHLKMIDFGFSDICKPGQTMSKRCGCAYYIAPEVLSRSYTEKADMWSLGVLVYMLLTGDPPFDGNTDEEKLARIRRGKPQLGSSWSRISESAQEFVLALLTVDSEKRLSAGAAIEHRWIRSWVSPQVAVDANVLSGLQCFADASRFRRLCLSVMAWSLTGEDEEELRLQFEALDQNHSGTLTLQELSSLLESTSSIDAAEAEALFHSLHMNGSEEIQYSEFLTLACLDRIKTPHEHLLHATFSRFDMDGSGSITEDNLRALLGDSFEGQRVEELLCEADRDRDGAVSYEDFRAYLRQDEEVVDEKEDFSVVNITMDKQSSVETVSTMATERDHEDELSDSLNKTSSSCRRSHSQGARLRNPFSPSKSGFPQSKQNGVAATRMLCLTPPRWQLPQKNASVKCPSPARSSKVDEGIDQVRHEHRWKLCFQRATCLLPGAHVAH